MIIYRSINTNAGTISLHMPEAYTAMTLSDLKDQAIFLHQEDKAYHNLMQTEEYDEMRDRQCSTLPSFIYLSNRTSTLQTLSSKRMISPFRCPVAFTTETYCYTQPISSPMQNVQLTLNIDDTDTETELITPPEPPPPPPTSPFKPSDIFQQTLEAEFTEDLIKTCAEILSQINIQEASISRKRRMRNDNGGIMDQKKKID